jgi:hypothetical protein
VESSCERGNETSGSVKCWETTEWLHNLWPLKWYSAPQLVSCLVLETDYLCMDHSNKINIAYVYETASVV